MFGLFKSYEEEYLELYEYLTSKRGFKAEYARAFLVAYRSELGKRLASGRRSAQASGPMAILHAAAHPGDDLFMTLVAQAYHGFMGDLRRGKHVGTEVEKAIWALLAEGCDILQSSDKLFAEYIAENVDEKFPGLADEVFGP